jgi:hypothetical protein
LLSGTPLTPGETRRVGFYFMSKEDAAEAMRKAGGFHLWEGKIVGEATIITQ